jgi:hypothetical protein
MCRICGAMVDQFGPMAGEDAQRADFGIGPKRGLE